jgi:hypothetical protein
MSATAASSVPLDECENAPVNRHLQLTHEASKKFKSWLGWKQDPCNYLPYSVCHLLPLKSVVAAFAYRRAVGQHHCHAFDHKLAQILLLRIATAAAQRQQTKPWHE